MKIVSSHLQTAFALRDHHFCINMYVHIVLLIPKYLNILGSKAKATARCICKEILIFDDFIPANFFYKSFQ